MSTASWPSALATAGTTAAKWVAIGDSVTEGEGASTRANRWIELATVQWRTNYGLASGGQGFIPAWYNVYAPFSTWAATQIATTGSVANANWGGIGYRLTQIGAAGTVTWTVTGTSVDIWYFDTATSFSYKVDGGSATTITGGGTNAVVRRTGVSLGTSGSHTVTVTGISGTSVVIGLMVYNNDATTGIQLYDAALTGISSGDYIGGSGADYADFIVAVSTIAPDMVTIDLGFNDPNASINSTTTISNIDTIVTSLRALPKIPDIVIIANYDPVGSAGVGVWPPYATALESYAGSHGLRLLDLYRQMPASDTSGSGLYCTDGLHPNNSGHARIAQLLVGMFAVSNKTSGLGDNLYVTGTDCSNDVGSVSKISAHTATLEVTGINKSAIERLPGLRDGQIQFAPFFNKLGAHAELATLPTTDIVVTYCRGTTIGNPAASLNGRQLNYDGKRDNKGGLVLDVTTDGDQYGLEWGIQLTAGIKTDTTATNGTSFDQGAAPSGAWGAQAYAHFFAMASTSCVVKVQHSTDNSTFTDLITFAAVATAGASSAQRVATSNTTQVNRYLRAISSGTFTSAAFSVMVNVNQSAGTVF